jgi:hypothetical protein
MHHVMAAPRELAAQLDLKRVAGVVVHEDAHAHASIGSGWGVAIATRDRVAEAKAAAVR